MFFSLAEKQKNRFYHDWPMRVIAIDTTRRHLYYSEPGSPLVEDAANTDNNNNNNNYEEHNQDSSLTRVRPSPHLIWRKKLKILSATIVAPDIGFVHDQTYVEQNLYQVEIVGEARLMSMGEVPPSGPLLCRCAGISSSHTCNNDGVKILRDPFHLAELYASMHTDDDAPQTSSAALNSPRLPAGGYFSRNRNKPITTRLRCCDEGVFRRVCFVLHTMLAKDGLMILPHGGLPPFDPRNGLSFAHVPMAVWQTFSMLEQVVCFIFTRVEVMNSVRASHNKSGSTVGAGALPTTTGGESVGVMCTDAYLCVTHNMMLIVDQNGSLLRWMHIDRIHTFAYNSRCGTPFAVCRSNTPQRDLLFTLQGPIYGDVARANYDGRMMMRRIHTILQVCHDALPPLHRASMKMVEVLDATYAEYVAHQSAMGQPLNLRSPPQEPLSCPLPKAQLAVVWQQMQDEVHPGEDGAAQDGGGHPEWERMLQTPVFGGDVAASSASVTASVQPTYPQREEARFRTQSKAPGLWWLEDQPQEDEQPTHPAGHDDVGVIVPAYTLDDLIRCSLAAVPRGSS